MNGIDKRVMFISDSLTDGGAQKVMAILASASAELGADASLVLVREKKKTYELSEKVKLYELKAKGSKFPFIKRIKQLREIIRTSEATTLIPFTPLIALYAFIANVGLGKRIVVSERGNPNLSLFEKGLDWKSKIGLLCKKMGLYRRADWVVFQTEDAQKCYSKKVQKKSCIIPNPLDLEKLPQRYEDDREKKVVAAGRLAEEKNFSLLLRAFSKFSKIHTGYKLVIYGEGSLRERLEAEIREYGMEDWVEMPGFVPNVNEKIRNAAMYVSTSNHEGISNSMLEALGMGVPTIVTDCPIGGARMFVKTDENGVLIPMNDEKALVGAMCKIAEDKCYADMISLNAIKIREEISADTISLRWMELVR